MVDKPSYPGMPRWVKVFGIIAISLVLVAMTLVFTGIGGPHGPGRHLPSDNVEGGTETSNDTRGSERRP